MEIVQGKAWWNTCSKSTTKYDSVIDSLFSSSDEYHVFDAFLLQQPRCFLITFPFLFATERGVNSVNAKYNNDYIMSCSNLWSLCSLFISYTLQCIHVLGSTERREEKQQKSKNGIISGHGWSSVFVVWNLFDAIFPDKCKIEFIITGL